MKNTPIDYQKIRRKHRALWIIALSVLLILTLLANIASTAIIAGAFSSMAILSITMSSLAGILGIGAFFILRKMKETTKNEAMLFAGSIFGAVNAMTPIISILMLKATISPIIISFLITSLAFSIVSAILCCIPKIHPITKISIILALNIIGALLGMIATMQLSKNIPALANLTHLDISSLIAFAITALIFTPILFHFWHRSNKTLQTHAKNTIETNLNGTFASDNWHNFPPHQYAQKMQALPILDEINATNLSNNEEDTRNFGTIQLANILASCFSKNITLQSKIFQKACKYVDDHTQKIDEFVKMAMARLLVIPKNLKNWKKMITKLSKHFKPVSHTDVRLEEFFHSLQQTHLSTPARLMVQDHPLVHFRMLCARAAKQQNGNFKTMLEALSK